MNDTERMLCDEIDAHRETKNRLTATLTRAETAEREKHILANDVTTLNKIVADVIVTHDTLRADLARCVEALRESYKDLCAYHSAEEGRAEQLLQPSYAMHLAELVLSPPPRSTKEE